MPRVAFVVGTASGGTASHVAALAAGCRDAGLEVRVLGPGSARPVRIGDRPRPVTDLAAIVGLRRHLRSWRPGVVHAHGVRAGAFAALALASWSGPDRPKLAVTIHNAPPPGRTARLVHGLLERSCARRADAMLCASADLAGRMRGLGARCVEEFDVPAPAHPAPADAAKAKARADIGANGRPVVLAAGRLAWQKGFDVLVDAAALWRHRVPAPRTAIAGAGPLAANLAVRASRSGADVVLLGGRDDVPALLAVADVVVIASRWEARALILQEAMLAGKPIVATRVGGTSDLTGEDAVVLVPPEDPAELAAAVTAVLDDPRLAARLSRAARTRSTSFPTQRDALRRALAVYARLTAGEVS